MFLKRKWKQLKPIAAESRLLSLASPFTSHQWLHRNKKVSHYSVENFVEGKKNIYSWNLLSRPQIIL